MYLLLLFRIIGKLKSSIIKSPPGRNALRRNRIMSLGRPAAVGEFCKTEIFLIQVINLFMILQGIYVYVYTSESRK